MKSLHIGYEPRLDNVEIGAAADFFRLNGVFEYVDMLNWPVQFPYKPSCRFKIARSAQSLIIYFNVVENNIRALCDHDQDSVEEDSCVALFLKIPGEKNYFSFEFNCIGVCRAAERESKEAHVRFLSTLRLDSIKRISTLGNSAFTEKNGNFGWNLTVEIPFSVIDIASNDLPKTLLANFYKCGDGTITPHYLSWSHILADQPDFHQPGSFGVLTL